MQLLGLSCIFIFAALNASVSWRVHLALLCVSVIYGTTFSLAKVIMPSLIMPYGFILLRVASACLLFFVFHALFIRQKVQKADYLPLVISALFGVAANMLMFFKGLSLTSPINASVLMLVTPVFVFVLSAIIDKKKPGLWQWLGLLLAALGSLWLMGGLNFRFSKATALGDVFIVLNALSYAIYLVYVKRLMLRYHPITVSKWNFIFGLLIVLPFGYQELMLVDFELFKSADWLILSFILLGTTFLTYLLNAWALGKAPSSLVGTYIYLQPVVATLLAILSKQDELGIAKICFILLIFAGVYLVAKKQKQTDGH